MRGFANELTFPASPAVQRWGAFRRFTKQQPIGALGGLVVVVLCVTAVFADHLAPYDPYQSQGTILQGPTLSHWFGLDNNGRDIFSRVLVGTKISMQIGIFSVILGTSAATVLGLISGYAGGLVDMTIQRVVDMFMAFPGFVLLLLLISIIGLSQLNVIIALALFLTFAPSRVIRSAVLGERGRDYVLAARTVGAGPMRILFRHIFPNVFPLVIVAGSIAVGGAILAEAALSFLGFGVPPPAVSWGRMIGLEGRVYFQAAPYMAIFPGLALSLAVFSFNMFGDALRDTLDPRLRRGS